MDLTIEEPEERRGKGRRGRMAYFEEDQPESAADDQEGLRQIQPPSNLGIAMRYTVYWTQVSGKQRVATHSVTFDVDPHLLVTDVVGMALLEFNKLTQDPSAKRILEFGDKKWEARFCTSKGLPRYDYPCRFSL
jgi:hypothetical protein